MFIREFTLPESSKRVTIVLKPAGWELCQESKEGVIQRTQYRDWHRVERALRAIGVNQVPEPLTPSNEAL